MRKIFFFKNSIYFYRENEFLNRYFGIKSIFYRYDFIKNFLYDLKLLNFKIIFFLRLSNFLLDILLKVISLFFLYV